MCVCVAYVSVYVSVLCMYLYGARVCVHVVSECEESEIRVCGVFECKRSGQTLCACGRGVMVCARACV